MKKFLTLAVAVATPFFTLLAQEDLTLEQAIMGRWTTFRPSSPSQLNWIPKEQAIAWVDTKAETPVVMKQTIPNGEPVAYFDLNLLKRFDAFAELKKMPRFKWVDEKTIRFRHKGKQVYQVQLNPFEVTMLYSSPEGANNIDVFESKYLAYTKGQNLFVQKDGNETQVTNDTEEGIVNGQSVHRFEFGIHTGTFWSNTGEMLAYYRKDETMVSQYPLANYTAKPASATPVRYPMAGMPSHEVTLGIYNVMSGSTVWLQTGEPKDQYLTNVAWGPKDIFIYVVLLNRDQNHLKLNQYNAKTGEFVKTILEEKHNNYVQPLHAMEFLPDNHKQFVWQSEKDGYNHLYLYDLKGKQVKQLTQGEYVVTASHGFDKAGHLVYTHTSNRGLNRVVSRVNVKSGKSNRITTTPGVHTVKMSTDGSLFIDSYSSVDIPRKVEVVDANGKSIQEVSKAENPFKDYKVNMPQLGVLKTNEGIELNYRMFKPYNFDASKKYKALVYVYNGPGVQLITNSWMAGASLWMPYMANKGYIVFTVDGRGSENRGRAFEQTIFKRLGEMELVDQLSGVEFLRNLDYVDNDKMAVHGWSYGGFMTTSLMLKAPGIFQVGVAGGPVIDWKYYEVMYTERYMDTPETNEAGFARASLLDKVENLKGDLLLIHGADDDVVVPQHSIDFIKHCVDKGVQIDFFLYPGHKHNVRGKDRVHLMQKVLNYIDEKLME